MKRSIKIYIKILIVICGSYLLAGLVLREMGMTKSSKLNKYYDDSSKSLVSESAEETEEIINVLTEEPSIVEIIFDPADRLFKLIGL